MLTHPTIDQLNQLQLRGMADALTEQQSMDLNDLSFEERLGLLTDRETQERDRRRLKTRLSQAKLRQSACIEDINFRAKRGLDKKLVMRLAGCDWIDKSQNVLICGPCGVGKSYLACALAHKACQLGYRARYIRVSRLLDDIALARADGSLPRFMTALARMHVLILDDFALTPPSEQGRRDLLEVIEDRHGQRATIITSQLPVQAWHDTLGEPTIADAILDRLVHNAHHINLTGDSMRRAAHAATPTT